uniref:Uncharacterized protein n=1 Tax=Arundo donax TaxID=35708 RepID=A0A0A8YNL5_ARUDO
MIIQLRSSVKRNRSSIRVNQRTLCYW